MDPVWYGSYDSDVPRALKYPQEPLPILVKRNAEKYPNNSATEFFGATLTYAALWKQIQSFANALSRMGVEPGTKVAIMLPNCPQAIISFYAVLWLGGVAVMTNPLYVEREMEHQWVDSEAKVLVFLDHLYPRISKVLPKTGIKKIIATSIKDYLPFPKNWLYPIKAFKDKLFTAVPYGDDVFNFSKLIDGTPPSPPPCPIAVGDLALLQYTGGTTGVAKGVMLSHANILANVVQIAGWFPALHWGKERFVAILPFFHVFGMTVAMNFPLYTGCTVILVPKFDLDAFIKTLQQTKPTLFPGVPTIFVAIVNHKNISSFDMSSIRYCITGSAPMPVEVLKKFEALTGSIIIEGYGLTESSPVTHCNPINGTRKAGSIGIPLPDTECRIVDLEMGVEELSFGQVGELVVKGPQVMLGYWKMPQETSSTLRDGWLYTGDIATIDEQGYTFIVDRKKDMIIAGGYNIYPREVDEVLYEHPKILDAVTVGVPDPYRGETVKVFIVPKPGQEISEKEIIQFCKSRLAAYKVPKIVEFRESLPKTTVGKVLRKELRKEAIEKQKVGKNED
ncbi:long-chain-fatty-acid--CoA ligase [Desulfoferrobacter suflitae]|uniref:long-chain-fatty-acid--CoA ligase n=1 Tax=Desulfoferrobacter suflitae TaxID=2865782 RepID=UPI0021644C2A|nr:long-chain fatty acid--CoA ligase [Desulfoferrobacter suflitae]MCK8600232.1 long-chain fatty acid--CoA ligase [Desulfoferrobacter suflitae]